MVTAPGIAGAGIGRRKVAATATAAATPGAAPAGRAAAGAQAATPKPMTGLGGRPVPVRGKPRYLGLILTGILLVFLALIAAWSSFFLAGLGGDQAAPATTAISQAETPAAEPLAETPAVPTPDPATAADARQAAEATPSAADEAAADGQDAAAAALTDTATTTGQVADAAPPADAGAAAAASVETTAAAGTATRNPAAEPAPGTVVSTEAAVGQTAGDAAGDEIFLAAMEPQTHLADPVSLPDAATAGDTLPAAAPEPPPFGTVYKFDAEGRIIPSPEGILTPDGVMLVAGKPARVPPPRPAAIAALAPPAPAAVAEPAAITPEAGATATPGAIALPGTGVGPADTPLQPNPELKGFKPRARPDGLVPAVQTTAPPPAANPQLAGFRPRARATSAGVTAAAASTGGLGDAPTTADESAADLAVDVSRLPPPRPAVLSQAVDAAVAAALAQPEPQADAAPEAQAEPEVDTPAPRIPTSASVAKTATEKDALNLSKIALIGVFGTESARYAYVRLGNGTLKKVKVGDSLDGGQVVAISATDLRYQKNGKLIVLALPKEG